MILSNANTFMIQKAQAQYSTLASQLKHRQIKRQTSQQKYCWCPQIAKSFLVLYLIDIISIAPNLVIGLLPLLLQY